MAKYLSQEWLDLHQELGARLPEVKGVTAQVEQVVPGSPEGEVRYVVSYRDGRVVGATAGTADDPDVTLTTNYLDTVKLLKGDLDANAAFMSGRTKVVGSTGRLLGVLALAGTPGYEAFREELAAVTEV